MRNEGQRQFSRVVSVLLALMLCLSALPVQAADGTGSITITNAQSGLTYTAYRLFDIFVEEDGEIVWTASEAQKAFYEASSCNPFLFIQNADGTYTAVWNTELSEAARVSCIGYLIKEGIWAGVIEEISAESQYDYDTDGGTVTITGLEDGLYYVDSASGAVVEVSSAGATVNEKDGIVPRVEKKIVDSETGEYVDSNTAGVGSVVEYYAATTLLNQALYCVMHDIMGDGLDFNNDVYIYTIDEEGEIAVLERDVEYSVYVGDCLEGILDYLGEDYEDGGELTKIEGCVFEIWFLESYLESLTSAITIYVEYSATVNENAIAGVDEYNRIRLEYYDPTTWQKVYEDEDPVKTTPEEPGENPGGGPGPGGDPEPDGGPEPGGEPCGEPGEDDEDPSDDSGDESGDDSAEASGGDEDGIGEVISGGDGGSGSAGETSGGGSAGGILPQTGQLNWPIPVMACCGIVLILLGAALNRRGSRMEEGD